MEREIDRFVLYYGRFVLPIQRAYRIILDANNIRYLGSDSPAFLIAGSPFEAFTLRLYDTRGRVALQARIFGGTKATFDIGGQAAGVYQVEVIGVGRRGGGRVVKE